MLLFLINLQSCTSTYRAGFRHVQDVRPNRGPHTLGAPTYCKDLFFVLSILWTIVVDKNNCMLITTESQMQVMVAGVVGRGGQPQVGKNFDLHPSPPPGREFPTNGQFKLLGPPHNTEQGPYIC